MAARPHIRQDAGVRLAILVALICVVGACSRKAGDACAQDKPCAEGLACLGDKCAKCEDSDACKLRGQCVARQNRCVVPASADQACREGHGSEGYNPCEREGLCTAVAGVCVASAEGCKSGRMCKSAGACSLEDGRCVAKTDADCTSAAVCLEIGQCSARDGVCAITKDADCAHAKGCLVSGQCSFDEGACVVLKDADCALSALCKAHGQCTAAKGKCIAEHHPSKPASSAKPNASATKR